MKTQKLKDNYKHSEPKSKSSQRVTKRVLMLKMRFLKSQQEFLEIKAKDITSSLLILTKNHKERY